MKIIKPWIANTLWLLTSYPAWVRFQKASKKVLQTQQEILFKYINKNKDTAFGERFSFSNIKTIAAYQERIPLTTYDDYIEEIDKIGRGESNILTTSQVRMFQLSSGSTAPSKLVPYTKQLHSEFQLGISPWIFNMFQNYPELKKGAAYWSISPLIEGEKFTTSGIPIGFEEDTAYLGRAGKILIDSIMAVPDQVKKIKDINNFRYVTLLFLLRDPNLRLISIWNPTFLTLLLTPLAGWWDQLKQDIKNGSLTPPKQMNAGTFETIRKALYSDSERAAQLSDIQPTELTQIWPNLKLISCWMDGPASSYSAELMKLFPGVIFQGKGLIATETFVSFPIDNYSGKALAINSHFFEFLPLDQGSYQVDELDPHLAHQLEVGKKYSVVITTGGGFYRYHLQDVVEVKGHYDQTPLIRFVSKLNQISDRFGEKLNEGFVSSVLEELFHMYKLNPIFSMLAPNDNNEGFRYSLYIELPQNQSINIEKKRIAQSLDRLLSQNFHYAYCRKLGQISHLDMFLISHHAHQAYLTAKQERGQKLGDIKNTSLETSAGWQRIFIPKQN
ncbi:MAG: GH3 auxin-responsive promoter family protein [Anaerolineae bacterium]|nr:GH3 auxin-responsive promoter family protein [Anaerolineae bacterium]